MQQGTITNLHIARVKETPSDPVQEATALSGLGLEGDRSCKEGNLRQILVMDNETLNEFGLKAGQIKENITTTGLDLSQTKPGQVFFVGDSVTLEIVGECEPCGAGLVRPQSRFADSQHRGLATKDEGPELVNAEHA